MVSDCFHLVPSAHNSRVLILVVVEYGLGQAVPYLMVVGKSVLILVVVEYGLGHLTFKRLYKYVQRLNPCCSGIWSRTTRKSALMTNLLSS